MNKITRGRKRTHDEFVAEISLINSDIIILGIYTGAGNRILVKCKIDGYEWMALPCALLDGHGCPVCSKSIVVFGINDLSVKRPDVYSWMINKDIIYGVASHEKELFKCPDCGKIFERSVSYACKSLRCPKCNRSASYGERILSALFNQLHIDYRTEKKFQWSDNKKYDFWIVDYNILVENHGLQHYEESYSFTRQPLLETQKNDVYKQQLASDNGISKYIVIDAKQSDFEYIKTNILNSELANIFDLRNINWDKVYNNSIHGHVRIVAELWNSGFTVNEIMSKICRSDAFVRKYLKVANMAGLCVFISKPKIYKRKCVCLNTCELFSSIANASSYYSIAKACIIENCNGTQKFAGKHPITKERLRWMDYDPKLHSDYIFVA